MRNGNGVATVGPVREWEDVRAAIGLLVVTILLLVALVAVIVTDVLPPDDAAAWVGVGLVGLGAAFFAIWLLALRAIELDGPARRRNDDYILAGLGVLFTLFGGATFAAGVLG